MGVGHTEWWEGVIGKGTARARGQRQEAYEPIWEAAHTVGFGSV